MNKWFWLLPLVSAGLGWMLTRLAIIFLFRPYQPVQIAGFRVQGMLTAQLQNFSWNTAIPKLTGLVPGFALADLVTGKASLQKILPLIEVHIDHFLRVKFGKEMPMIGMFIGDKTITEMKSVFMKELEEIFPTVMSEYVHTLQKEHALEKLLAQKMTAVSPARLEEWLEGTLKKEFRLAVLAGTLIGLLTGLFELALIFIFSQ